MDPFTLAALLLCALLLLLCLYWFFIDLTDPPVCTYHYDGYCEIWEHEHHPHTALKQRMVWWLAVILLLLPFLIG
jgi:hypothetical protein